MSDLMVDVCNFIQPCCYISWQPQREDMLCCDTDLNSHLVFTLTIGLPILRLLYGYCQFNHWYLGEEASTLY